MEPLFSPLLIQPGDQFVHSTGRIERRCRFENDAEAITLFIKRFHVVGESFVCAAMPLVLYRMRKKVAVELTDMILGERNSFVSTEDDLHHLRIAGNFLLVACRKRPQANVCQQLFDLSVGEACPFDTLGRTDALARSDTSEAGQPFRRDPADRTPSPLEFIDFGDQRQDFGRDPGG